MSKSVAKTVQLLALPLAIQLAVIGVLCWRHHEDMQVQQRNIERIGLAAQINALAGALAGLVDKQPSGFARSGRDLVQHLQETAAKPAVHEFFDANDYKMALAELSDIEDLSAKGQDSFAGSYRHQLALFAEGQTSRASQVMAQSGNAATESQLTFIYWCIGGVVLDAAALIWCIAQFNFTAAKRLNIISDNTERLQHGMTLNTLFSGTDGFAQLDKRFHDMADSLEKAQDRLRKGEARFRRVLENMPVGVLLATTGGIVESANPRACEILACSHGRISGKPVAEFLLFPVEQSLESIANNERTSLIKGVRDDRTGFSAEIHVSKYRDESGEKLLISFEDVTWRIELERMKREFMAMISHDIRTPLTSISATLGMLSAGGFGDLSDDAMKRIEKDEDSLEHLMRLLNDLLSIEKIASTNFTLQKTATTTAKVVERTLAVVSPTARSRQIDVSIAGTHTRIFADEDRMVQVLTNLLTNALKFSPAGGTVTVAIENLDEGVRVQVTDQGCGIAETDQAMIFESFGQVQSKEFAGAKGMGLGLAICKQIVVLHGGQIGVTSAAGKGTTFWLTIPHSSSMQLSSSPPAKESLH